MLCVPWPRPAAIRIGERDLFTRLEDGGDETGDKVHSRPFPCQEAAAVEAVDQAARMRLGRERRKRYSPSAEGRLGTACCARTIGVVFKLSRRSGDGPGTTACRAAARMEIEIRSEWDLPSGTGAPYASSAASGVADGKASRSGRYLQASRAGRPGRLSSFARRLTAAPRVHIEGQQDSRA